MSRADLDARAAAAQVASRLLAARRVAVACHVNPDGDALGSMLGMAAACRAAGKQVVAGWADNTGIPWSYRHLPGQDLVVDDRAWTQAAATADVVMTFDCGSLDRLGQWAPAVEAAATRGVLVVVDHHLTNTRFGSLNVIDPDAAATGAVVHSIMRAAGWPLNRDVAWCLYVALATDTGRFQFASTTPAVFELAKELASFDLPIADISRELFEESSINVLHLCGEVLAGLRIEPLAGNTSAVVAVLTADQLQRHDVAVADTEPLIELVRRAAEAEVALLLKETAGGIRGSMRSLGAVDVAAIAVGLGGGGHRFAAGFTVADTLAGAEKRVLGALRSALVHDQGVATVAARK